jgi:hypothetical protein
MARSLAGDIRKRFLYSGSFVGVKNVGLVVVAAWMILGEIICQVLCTSMLVIVEMSLGVVAAQPVEMHIHRLQCLWHDFVGEKCVCCGVAGLHWFLWLEVSDFLKHLMNRAPSSASAAVDMTACIIWEMLRMSSLFVGMSSLPDMNMCPPARLQAFGLDSYDDSLLWVARTIALAL